MKILHLTGSLSRKSGGLFYSVRRLSQEQARQGASVSVIGLEDEHTAEDIAQWKPLEPEALEIAAPRFWGYAPRLGERLEADKPEIIHLHGL